MFELLQTYETANHEKNDILRFIYIKYIRHKLKSSFFGPFKKSIKSMRLNKELLDEFFQFYQCTQINTVFRYDNTELRPTINFVSEYGSINIFYYDYRIKFNIFNDHCNITVEPYFDMPITIHPEISSFYSGFFAEIIIMAIYNYCVRYIYGNKSKLYVNDMSYIYMINNFY